ncbi:hypothetical protein Tco_0735664 [Tanacetum coccineum]
MKLEQFQINTKFLNSLPPEWSKFVTDVKLVRDLHTTNFDQLHAYLEQHELHANEVRIMCECNQYPLALVANRQMTPSHFNTYQSSYNNPQFQQQFSPSQTPQYGSIHPTQHYLTTYPSTSHPNAYSSILRNSSNPRQQATIHDGKVNVQPVLLLADPGVAEDLVTHTVITHNAAYQVDDLDAYDSDCDDFSTAKVVLLANLSSYGSDVLSENEITSDSNIIPYSQYLLETQNVAVQDINSPAQQDAMILFVFEQLSNQVTNCNKVNKNNLIANESLSGELERYKERVKLLEERQNVDLIPAGSVVPTGKDSSIVSTGSTNVIPAVLYNLYRRQDLSRAGPTSGIRAWREPLLKKLYFHFTMTSQNPSQTYPMPSPSVSSFTFPSTTEPVFSASTSEPVFESPNHTQPSQTTQSQQLQQYHTTTVSNNNAKFPYLKKEEYETWAMKMEYWIMNSDHNLWNIVLNGNSRKRTGRDPKGNIMILPPVSVEEQIAVQRETKARTILLQSLPEDHMADFHHLDDARDIWLAVKARFGGNDESKKMRKSMLKQEFSEFRVSESEGLHKGYDRFQKILSQLNQMQAKPDNEDCNMKFLRALPPSWSQVAITLKTKGGLDYLSFDDLYNKLRTLEIDVKGGSSYDSRGTSAPPIQPFNVIESVLHSFVAESDPQQQITYEDFDQIGKMDLEELDIKWQMAMLSVRINRFEKKA